MTVPALVLTILLAYGLIHKGLPGRTVFVYLIMITMVLRAGLIPTYMVIRSLGILDALLPVVLGPCVNAFYFMLMMSFFRTVPRDFSEATEMGRLCTYGITRRKGPSSSIWMVSARKNLPEK